MAFSPSAPLGAILLGLLFPARVDCSVEGRGGPSLPHNRLIPTESPARPRRGATAPPPPWRHVGPCRHGGAQARPVWLREGLLPRRLPSSLTASKRGRSGGRRGQPPRAGEQPRAGGRDGAAGGGPFSASSSAPSLAGAPLPPSDGLELGTEPSSTAAGPDPPPGRHRSDPPPGGGGERTAGVERCGALEGATANGGEEGEGQRAATGGGSGGQRGGNEAR